MHEALIEDTVIACPTAIHFHPNRMKDQPVAEQICAFVLSYLEAINVVFEWYSSHSFLPSSLAIDQRSHSFPNFVLSIKKGLKRFKDLFIVEGALSLSS